MPALVNALKRVDLPTLGRPTMPHLRLMMFTSLGHGLARYFTVAGDEVLWGWLRHGQNVGSPCLQVHNGKCDKGLLALARPALFP
jgi:hypothetical protein